jgi:hypothetical protein
VPCIERPLQRGKMVKSSLICGRLLHGGQSKRKLIQAKYEYDERKDRRDEQENSGKMLKRSITSVRETCSWDRTVQVR